VQVYGAVEGYVKEMLGHANISQTDTYLNAGRIGLHESMRGSSIKESVGQKRAPD
jgi:hypothetical protein